MYSCGSDTVTNTTTTPDANTISGTITFTDTTNISSGGFYNVSAFTSWYPTGQPSSSDTLHPVKSGNVYTATYKLKGLNNGYYFLAAAWTKIPYQMGGNYVTGLHGCDTSHSFSCRPDSLTISNNAGLTGINFLSVMDTNKAIIKF